MVQRLAFLVFGVWLAASCLSVRAFAQDGTTASSEVLDAEELGVSLARIQRRLERLPDERDPTVLRLDFYVQVYGRAPELNLLEGFDVHNSPIPYGVPMHKEMMAVMHSNPVYPPAANLNPVAGWAWRSLRP